MSEETMTGKEVVFATGVNDHSLSRWAREGRVKAWKDQSGFWIFDVQSLIAYCREYRESLAKLRGRAIADDLAARAWDKRFR